jgi:hypothetical protein
MTGDFTAPHTMSTPVKENTPKLVPRNGYPGLGLTLWEIPDYRDVSFPLGAHACCVGSQSKPLPVREFAMLSVMETLTDKSDWHRKVFDEEIVAKWRKEALAIPNEQFWNLSRSSKRQEWDDEGNVKFSEVPDHLVKIPEDILSVTTFDCVSCLPYATLNVLMILNSASMSFAVKQGTLNRQVSYLPWMRTRRSQSQTVLYRMTYTLLCSMRSKLYRQTKVTRQTGTRIPRTWSKISYILVCIR